MPVPTDVDNIDALLPQTQCQRCGYSGCQPYAQAIADGEADINRCPPGGDETISNLAAITGRPAKPLAPECGTADQRNVAFIREDECIGCTKCIQVCPVDAILGAAKQMHTIIAGECTGCELCVPACPVDCIDLPPAAADTGPPHWPAQTELDTARAAHARRRYRARNQRLEKIRQQKATERQNKKHATASANAQDGRKSEIAAAIERAKQKRAAHKQ